MQINKESHGDFFEFLSFTLKREEFEIFPLAGDASSRRYYRVVAENESWVLMSWDPFVDDGTYPFLNVRDHFEKHGVHVPEVIGKSPTKGLILLEDLGDLTLERKFWENQNQQTAIPFYRQAIDEIVKVHYDASFDRNDCTAFKIMFDTERLLWEMNYGREHLLEKLCGGTLSGAEATALQDVFTHVCTTLHREEKFIAHRDYHSRNLMIKFGKMRVIDFQDARLGPIQYDLVSLLRDSYVRLDSEIADGLIEYYLQQRMEHGRGKVKKVSRDEFYHVYEIQTIQRCFKACGSFASFYNLRQDTRYLKYLHHTLSQVGESLRLFPEYRAFLDILTDRGLFERKYDDL